MSADPMLPLEARLIAREDLLPDHALFRLRPCFDADAGPTGANHRPGQFVMLSVLGAGEAPISICHAPHPNGEPPELELTIRRVGRVTGALFRLSPGARLGLRGPYGRGYPLEDLAGHDLVLMAGGLGMAPLRSLLQYAHRYRERLGPRVHLLYGTRSADQFLHLDELVDIARQGRVHVHLSCDEPPGTGVEPAGVPLRQGNLLDLLAGLDLDPTTTRFAVCGPPVMYGYVTARLRELQVHPEHIYVSLERRMACGVGKCGHCAVGYQYTCVDGPVFSVWEARGLREAWESPASIDDPYSGGWR